MKRLIRLILLLSGFLILPYGCNVDDDYQIVQKDSENLIGISAKLVSFDEVSVDKESFYKFKNRSILGRNINEIAIDSSKILEVNYPSGEIEYSMLVEKSFANLSGAMENLHVKSKSDGSSISYITKWIPDDGVKFYDLNDFKGYFEVYDINDNLLSSNYFDFTLNNTDKMIPQPGIYITIGGCCVYYISFSDGTADHKSCSGSHGGGDSNGSGSGSGGSYGGGGGSGATYGGQNGSDGGGVGGGSSANTPGTINQQIDDYFYSLPFELQDFLANDYPIERRFRAYLRHNIDRAEYMTEVIQGFKDEEITVGELPQEIKVIDVKLLLDESYGAENFDDSMIDEIMDLIENDPDVTTAVEAVDKIITEGIEDVPCLMDIYEDLGGSETIQGVLNNFRDDINFQNPFNPNVADLIFENDDNFTLTHDEEDWNTGAYTYWENPSIYNGFSSNKVVILFNTDALIDISTRSVPDVVKTTYFLHEIIHAEMFRFLMENLEQSPPGLYNESVLLDWLTKRNFDNIFNAFAIVGNGNDIHHELLANSYRDIIKQALSEIYPELTIPELNALSWLGLEYTIEFETQVLSNPIYYNNMDNTRSNIFNTYTNGCNN